MKFHKFTQISGILGVLTFLSTGLYGSEGPLSSVNRYEVGYITLQEGAFEKGDFLLSVFSDDLSLAPNLRSAPQIQLYVSPTPLPGCLSVAQVQLHSGVRRFQKPGRLTFRCKNVPPNASIYGWIEGQWQKLHSERSKGGQLSATIRDLTIYAIFTRPPVNELQTSLGRI